MRVKDAVGRFGEDLAARWLTESGWQILARNWRCPEGELDLIGLDGAVLAFVEVKTRSTLAFGDPAEAVTPAKSTRIHRLAGAWLASDHPPLRWSRLRFDVVTVVRLGPAGHPQLRHLPGAF
jgi:putative endonuclease